MRTLIEDRIWPTSAVDRLFADEFVRRHPAVLLIQHPVRKIWQLYYSPFGWTAERLVTAIRNERAIRDRIQSNGDVDPETARRWRHLFWWRDCFNAPRIFEDNLPLPPGPWMFAWLAEAAGTNAREFLHQIEEEAQHLADARRQKVSDMHEAVASDARRVVRDVLDGDPLAGHRHWAVSMPRTTKEP